MAPSRRGYETLYFSGHKRGTTGRCKVRLAYEFAQRPDTDRVLVCRAVSRIVGELPEQGTIVESGGV